MRNLAFVIALLFTGLVFSHTVNAQTAEKKWALGTGASFIDYQAPQTGKFFQGSNFDPGLHVSLHRYLTGAFNMSTHITLAQGIRFPGQDWTVTRPNLVDMSYLFTFKFNNGAFARESAFFAPYLHFGIGGSYVPGHPDLYVPLGGGLQFRLSPKVALRTQVTVKRSLNKDHQHVAHALSFVYNLAKDKPEVEKPAPRTPAPEPLLASLVPKDADDDGIIDERDECPYEAGLITYHGCPNVDALNFAKIKDTPIAYEGDDPLAGLRPSDNQTNSFATVSDLSVLEQRDVSPSQQSTDLDLTTQRQEPTSPSTPAYNEPTFLDPIASKDIKESTEIDFSETNNAGNGSTFSSPNQEKHNQLIDNQLAIDPVLFLHDSYVLTDEAKAVLDEVASMLHTHSEAQLVVKGHADALGTDQYNLVLSIMRAYHVKYYLVNERGISQHRITSNGFGEEAPLAGNTTDSGRQQNRRVDFELVF